MNNVSKLKIILGYGALLAFLFYSLFFVRREMDRLLQSGTADVQWTDSLFSLLREKDKNTLNLLRTLSTANDSMLSTYDIKRVIATQDTVIPQRRIQRRVITHRDTIVTPKKKKGFFRRLKEAFVPPKKDSSVNVKNTLEFVVDTIIETYNPVDSLQRRLQEMSEARKEENRQAERRKRSLQRRNSQLTARIDSMLHNYETITMERALQESERRQTAIHRSATTVGSIAVGAVVLAALFLFIIIRDVTRSNRYRRQLEEARRKAEDLLATREKLMLAITHDFKAPLGSIMGYADLLSHLIVDKQQQFYLDNMKVSSEHLLKLVTDLLDFHRLDLHKVEINRVSFTPAQMFEDIRVSFEPLTTAKGLTLHCDIAPELNDTYQSDPLRLKQIVNNLLSNAVKFTSHGSITLSARCEQVLGGERAGNRLVLSVADTGQGMKPSDRQRIFREFTRLPGAQGEEGFGLGLSIVQMLVQLLRGTITVDSELGKGSTFTVDLPLHRIDTAVGNDRKKAAASEAAPSAPRPADHLQPRRLLLIDDDRIQLTLTAAMLQQNGFEAVTCLQTDELLDALRTGHFLVLLTDVQMPAINGFDLLKLLRASNVGQSRTLPIIAVTARSDMERDDFVAHGFVGCLHKPFNMQELLQELERVFNQKDGQPTTSVKTESPAKASESNENSPSETVNSSAAPKLTQQADAINLSALTAFSGDDEEAAHDILNSFMEETDKNIERLKQAIDQSDTEVISAVAHKMLPLFTLIGANSLTVLLRTLEAARFTPHTPQLDDTARQALAKAQNILDTCRKQMAGSN